MQPTRKTLAPSARWSKSYAEKRSSSRARLWLCLALSLTSLTPFGCCTAEATLPTQHSCPEPSKGDAARLEAAQSAGHDLPHYRRLIGYCWPAAVNDAD